jgi:hypothetical protein
MLCLWGLCLSVGLGILLTGMTAVWLVLSSRGPRPAPEDYAENFKLK